MLSSCENCKRHGFETAMEVKEGRVDQTDLRG